MFHRDYIWDWNIARKSWLVSLNLNYTFYLLRSIFRLVPKFFHKANEHSPELPPTKVKNLKSQFKFRFCVSNEWRERSLINHVIISKAESKTNYESDNVTLADTMGL